MNREPYYKLYKSIMKELGTDSACIYAVMLDFCEYARREKQLTKDGYFFLTIPTLEEITGLKRKRQDKAIKKLESAGLINSRKQGMPAKRFFQFVPIGQTRLSQMDKQDCPNGTNKIVPNGQTRLSQRDNNKEHNYKEHNYKEHNYKGKDDQRVDKNHPIVILYRNNWGLPSTVVLADIIDDLEKYGEEWVMEGFKEALRCNGKNWKYVQRILTRWGLQYDKVTKPWELEKGQNGGRNKGNSKKIFGNATAEQWKNEPAEL